MAKVSVGCPGNPHTPILNKYCVVPPQFLLNTNEHQKQAGHLAESDLGAVWEMLSSLGSGKGKNGYFVIYNCGVEAEVLLVISICRSGGGWRGTSLRVFLMYWGFFGPLNILPLCSQETTYFAKFRSAD